MLSFVLSIVIDEVVFYNSYSVSWSQGRLNFTIFTIFAGEVILYNIFYEVFTVCTSVVAQDSSGESGGH